MESKVGNETVLHELHFFVLKFIYFFLNYFKTAAVCYYNRRKLWIHDMIFGKEYFVGFHSKSHKMAFKTIRSIPWCC